MTKLIVCGDSISAGSGILPSQCYGKLVADTCGMAYVNTSVPGETSSGIFSNLQTRVFDHLPTHCIIMVGTNDIRLGQLGNLRLITLCDQYINTMANIISSFVGKGIKLTIMSPPVPREPSEIGRTQHLSSELRMLCNTNGINFIDIFERTHNIYMNVPKTAWEGYYQTNDLVHYNALGHVVFKDIILQHNLG